MCFDDVPGTRSDAKLARGISILKKIFNLFRHIHTPNTKHPTMTKATKAPKATTARDDRTRDREHRNMKASYAALQRKYALLRAAKTKLATGFMRFACTPHGDEPPPPSSFVLPENTTNWEKARDNTTGEECWLHKITGEVTRETPEEIVNFVQVELNKHRASSMLAEDVRAMSAEDLRAMFYKQEWVNRAAVRLDKYRMQGKAVTFTGRSGYIQAIEF